MGYHRLLHLHCTAVAPALACIAAMPWSSIRTANPKLPVSLQRFASGSLFKRTVFQYIAEDLAADPTTEVSCAIDSQARPLVIMPTDSPLQTLLTSLDLEENEAVDRHSISEGLRRLGESSSIVPLHDILQQLSYQL